jgi:hypothetical protein
VTTAGYSTPDAVRAWQDFWPILTALVVAALWLWRRGRRWLRDFSKGIRDDVREVMLPELLKLTRPIQPDSNGGKSLPDLHEKVDTAIKTLNELQRAQTTTAAALLEHIANHRDPDPTERTES